MSSKGERGVTGASGPSLPLSEDGSVLNLQLVGENGSNLPNKCIIMGMTCRYSMNGIIGLRYKVTFLTGSCSLIIHFNKYLSAATLSWQTKLGTLYRKELVFKKMFVLDNCVQ